MKSEAPFSPLELAPLEAASTVILLRDGAHGLETLMLERLATGGSFAGVWAFPGGKVDPEDSADQDDELDGEKSLDGLAAARRAGSREVAEETGQRILPQSLVPLSLWTPMQRLPRRFKTWFFVAPAARTPITINPAEHVRSEWLTAREALARHGAQAMKLVVPTWLTLFHLQAFESVDAALHAASTSKPAHFNSQVLPYEANLDSAIPTSAVMWEGDEAYHGDAASTPVISGSRHRVNIQSLPWKFEHD